MKFIIALLAVFVLIGCQTTDELPKNTLPKKEVKPVASEPTMPVIPDLFNSQKPIVCGKPEVILSRISNNAKETPVIFWQSEPFGYPAVLYLNQKTGTTTILDFLDPDKICIISAGINVKLSEEFMPTKAKGRTIKYLTN